MKSAILMNFCGVTDKDENERANFFEMKSKNHWLLLVFFVYLSNLVLFSLVYTWLYRSHPVSFLFNSDIITAKNISLKKESTEEIASSQKVINYIKLLFKALDNQDLKIEEKLFGRVISALTEDNVTFRFIEYVNLMGPEVPTGTYNVEVFDKDNNRLISIELAAGISDGSYIPKNKNELKALVNEVSKKKEAEIDDYKKIITSIDRDKITPWGYLDFFYFSCITQSTVGYGDIIPNTTTARLIISLQTIIGTLLLGIFINFSLKE